MAERQGFEPWEALTSTVFKTAAFDHSATSPHSAASRSLQIVIMKPPRKRIFAFENSVLYSGRRKV